MMIAVFIIDKLTLTDCHYVIALIEIQTFYMFCFCYGNKMNKELIIILMAFP